MNQDTINKIEGLCGEGEALFAKSDFELAKKKYIEAIKLVPEPENIYPQSTWIYVAIGDCQFKLKNYEKCFNCFYNAVQCPNGLGNPFIHLRLGQMYFEQEEYEKSVVTNFKLNLLFKIIPQQCQGLPMCDKSSFI